jgi:hypothetical protein
VQHVVDLKGQLTCIQCIAPPRDILSASPIEYWFDVLLRPKDFGLKILKVYISTNVAPDTVVFGSALVRTPRDVHAR